ncbi:MAG: lipoyl(octanoyl) transferase LipB [Candidatus Omnitrophota bacterium]
MIIVDLGTIGYASALQFQYEQVEKVRQGEGERLLLCEHPAVLTLGRSAHKVHVLKGSEWLVEHRIRTLDVDRGGDVTLHAPGQLVAYPILDLTRHGRDLHRYLHQLEQVAIDFMAQFDIVGERMSGRTGVWVGPRKCVSIGIGIKKWISFHGVGININTDLELFSLIKPCGLDVQMTSMAREKGEPVDMNVAKDRLVQTFRDAFPE